MSDLQIFGSFYLCESEFAIAVSSVQEVVNAPGSYTRVPLAPEYLKGLFNLRGTVIPVLDLRGLLKLDGPLGSEQKIAIVEVENTFVGLLFDQTGEVFRSQADERSDFDPSQTSGVVSGVFKKDDGKRIIQILDAQRLFKLQNIPKDQSRLGRGAQQRRGQRKQCISFVVGPATCALPISDIQEILKIKSLGESALSVGNCIGTIDLRGATVPVVDFPALLGYRQVDRSREATLGDRRVVVMRLGNEMFGLLVDSVNSIISHFADELIPFPLVDQERADMFVGCIAGHGETEILLLNHQRILTHDEINQITRGHSDLYQTRQSEKETEKAKSANRRTYITFTIGGIYAVPIDEIREIIESPKRLLQLPGLEDHVSGALNLRGNLVTIVDARKLYNAPEGNGPANPAKVLIFNQSGIHFGLIVDTVEAIVNLAEDKKIKLPSMLYHSEGGGSSEADISEVIEFSDPDGTKKSAMILSVTAVAQKIRRSLAA